MSEHFSQSVETTTLATTLDELLADPRQVERLTPKEAHFLLLSCSTLLIALATRCWEVPTEQHAMIVESGQLLTMPAVAELLRVPENQARELGRKGQLPTVKV